jgi:hypothetical protein
MILRCPRCWLEIEWTRAEKPQGPGYCVCGTSALWRVVQKRAENKGHVIVMGHKGWQELKGPHFQDDPNGWRKEPAPA